MTTSCADPITFSEVFDYWAGELEPHAEERVEDHVFTCPGCAAMLAEGEALVTGIRTLVRAGTFHALVTESVLNRLARDGARIRTYALDPGEVVPCSVWEDDELVVTRLRGDFSRADALSVVATMASGEELSRSEAVPIQQGQRELIHAMSAEWLRRLPSTTVRMRVTTTRDGEEQLLGEYTLEHTALS